MTEPATDPQPYRPDSYWNPGLMVIANIKGDKATTQMSSSIP